MSSSSERGEKRKERKETIPSTTTINEGEKLAITLIPRTWIISPIMPKETIQRWIKAGWIKEEEGEHIDRAFPRLDDGKPFLHRLFLKAVIRRAYEQLSQTDPTIKQVPKKEIVNFSIVDEKGLPVNYIVIPDQPLKYTRSIGGTTAETFEYIDDTYKLQFIVKTKYPREFAILLAYGGEYIGMGPRTSTGYGRFRVTITPLEQKQ